MSRPDCRSIRSLVAGEEEEEEEGVSMGRVRWEELFTLGTPCPSRVLGASHLCLASLALGAVSGQ